MITTIVAINQDGYIGINNTIPWKIKDDMKFFRKMTTENTIVMGRKTFDSMGSKPLPKRHNIIITSSPEKIESSEKDGWVTKAFNNITDALFFAESLEKETFIIGGSTIYEQTMSATDRILLTTVKDKTKGDVKFPGCDKYDSLGEYFKLFGFNKVDVIEKYEANDDNQFDCEMCEIKKVPVKKHTHDQSTIQKFIKMFKKQTLNVEKKERKKQHNRKRNKNAKKSRRLNR